MSRKNFCMFRETVTVGVCVSTCFDFFRLYFRLLIQSVYVSVCGEEEGNEVRREDRQGAGGELLLPVD